MKDFPHLELRRADLRNQLNTMRKDIGFGLSSDTIGSQREEMYREMLTGEIQELDFVLGYFARSSWAVWQWALLAVVSFLSLGVGAAALWTLIAG